MTYRAVVWKTRAYPGATTPQTGPSSCRKISSNRRFAARSVVVVVHHYVALSATVASPDLLPRGIQSQFLGCGPATPCAVDRSAPASRHLVRLAGVLSPSSAYPRHGLGDTALSDGISEFIDDIKAVHPGIFVHSVQIPQGGSADDERKAGFVRGTCLLDLGANFSGATPSCKATRAAPSSRPFQN